MNAHHFLRSVAASALASTLILQAAIAHADDTEIFFGGSAIDEGIRPNVLFILDDSGSMQGTRMTQLKTAFGTIINNAGNINVGVMAMNTKSGGSRLLSPVQNINDSINVKLATPAIIASGDDASRINGSTNISDATLVMGQIPGAGATYTQDLGVGNDNSTYYIKGGYSCSAKITTARSNCDAGGKTQLNARSGSGAERYTGLFLFRNLNIPNGATITSAKLTLTAVNTQNSKPAVTVSFEKSKTPAAFNDASTFADRDFSITATLANSSNKLLTPWTKDQPFEIDITDQLTLLKSPEPSANPIGDLALQFRSTTNSDYIYYVGDALNAPKLTITYSTTTDTSRATGLRFQNVAIPSGATITSARIDFVPASSDDRTVVFDVSAEDTSDAAEFTPSNDFVNRAKTAPIDWKPEEWRTASPQVHVEGPTVTSLVQTIVNRNGWCGNNSMAFIFNPKSGTGSRTAFSVDAGLDLQPVLNVSYTGGTNGCLDPILDISVIDGKDDAHQSGTTVNLTSTTMPFSASHIATRYQKVPVKQGATVKSAQVFVTPNNTTTGSTTIQFQNIGNSAALTTANNNLSNRTLGSSTTCTISPSTAGTPVEANCGTDGVKTLLQSVFSRSDWADGNALTMMLKPTTSNLALRSRDAGATNGITLRIKLASGGLGANSYTVRDYTNGIVQALAANGGTPIVPTLYDAAGYLVQKSGKHVSNVPSPITSSCQANYLVLLTDGEANGTDNASKNGIASMTGSACTGDSGYDSERCARTLAQWMATQNVTDFDGLNTITTHTIGFNTSSNAQATALLRNLATLGGGTAYQAENANDLATAFDDIVQAALATNTSFVNSSAPVNSFNRADNLDELYFALFKPSETDRWAGNLKRYRLRTDGDVATIVDADNSPAIDKNTGFFKSNARSFWSTTQDGNDITKGGAALKLPAPANRKLFTYLDGTMQNLITTNNSITKARLGDSTMSDTERGNLLSYIRGFDINNTTPRQALGDPIHSSPKLVTYGCNGTVTNGKCSNPDISAVMGSNEGFIHSFNTTTGVEEYAFMPEALLPNIKQLRGDSKSTATKPRLYGMDNTLTIWANDANNDGKITGNDFVYAYATMGRGGRNLYALDITDRNSPKVLWQIIGGATAGFEKLGQTWSAPAKTKIKVGGTVRDVLVFGGGYDDAQDTLNNSTSTYAADNMGNAIYIVDAKTGAKIWSAGTGSGHSVTLAKMKYSIPSSVRVITLPENQAANPEQLADQFFVGDMGGQVWRFFINNGSTGSGLVTPGGTSSDGVFASIGGTTAASARRFYNEPDVALLNVKGRISLTVNIGSGYRGHPLNEYIRDRFYSFRTTSLFKNDAQKTLTESDLYDATTNLRGGTNFEDPNTGWYITLAGSGEKVLSRALTVGGDLYFNTYEPSRSTAACSASVGKNRSYAVSLMYATPASYTVNADGSITYGDRSATSNSGGIAGDPQLFCSGDNCWVLPDPSIDPVKTKTPPLGKTYWTDKLDLD